jgi:hypothetical protein
VVGAAFAVVCERVWTFDTFGFLADSTATGLLSATFFFCSSTGGGIGFLRCGITAGGIGFFFADSVALNFAALGLVVIDKVVLAPELLLIGVFAVSEGVCCAAALVVFFTEDTDFVDCPSGLAGVAAFDAVVELGDACLA